MYPLDKDVKWLHTPATVPVAASEVKRIRKRLGLTQQQLAKELGVSREAVNHWEAGRYSMSEPAARLLVRMDKEGNTKRKKLK